MFEIIFFQTKKGFILPYISNTNLILFEGGWLSMLLNILYSYQIDINSDLNIKMKRCLTLRIWYQKIALSFYKKNSNLNIFKTPIPVGNTSTMFCAPLFLVSMVVQRDHYPTLLYHGVAGCKNTIKYDRQRVMAALRHRMAYGTFTPTY